MLTPGFETGPDGPALGALDSALLGGPPQRVGTFEYRYDTDIWTWSDTVAQMHGYEPGEVQPTTELVLSHKHPDDLARVKALLKQSSAPFSTSGTAAGHTTWTCRTCDQTVYGPLLNTHCSALDGPATARN